MTQTKDQTTTEKDYSKPHAFEMEVGRITRVCKCGAPHGAEIHSFDARHPIAPYSKRANQCLAKADDDMPLFVLKPTDSSSVELIETWYRRNAGIINPDKLADVLEVRNAFKRWQASHPDRVKLAD